VGVAIGIAAMSLIVALATGMQQALDSPALLNSQVHQVAVYPPAGSKAAGFDAGTLTTLSSTPHIRAAWGQLAMSGVFIPLTPRQSPAGALVSLPPLGESAPGLNLMAGRLPRSDTAAEVLLTDNDAAALGFATPAAAVDQPVYFSASNGSLVAPGVTGNQVLHAVPMQLIVSGIISSHDMPAGAAGGMAPYGLLKSYWSQVAQANGWRGGEFSSISLLADSAPDVDSVRARVEALGFQTKTFGDAFRSFEDLLSKLKVALLGLALVALMLACLGIANTMYTAVLERTKEIGVFKALGARAKDILLVFVAESALIGLAGGLAGAVVAVALARLGNSAVNRLAHATGGAGIDVFRADLTVVAAALVLAVALSMVSGLLPALRAAREDPARALRYE
jgi:putative ABC transport system permease protein